MSAGSVATTTEVAWHGWGLGGAEWSLLAERGSHVGDLEKIEGPSCKSDWNGFDYGVDGLGVILDEFRRKNHPNRSSNG